MATTSGHTIKAFDEDLDRLRALISQMGGLAEHAIRESMRCLVQRDLEGAQKIVDNDKKLDALEIETERRAIQLHRPARADGGRFARCRRGDQDQLGGRADRRLCQEYRQARAACSKMPATIEPLSLMPEMARIATEMVHDVLTAFVERDAEAAVRVCERDRAVDDFYNSIFRTLLTFMMENPRQYRPVDALAVHRQEHRAGRRPRHQHRRNGLLRRHRPAPRRPPARQRSLKG